VRECPECFGGIPLPQRTRKLSIGVAEKAESTFRAVGILWQYWWLLSLYREYPM